MLSIPVSNICHSIGHTPVYSALLKLGKSIYDKTSGCLFNPLNLFSASEPGVWYDPSDLTTLFQDNNGTTPVTAVNQPVGLMLDKSKSLAIGQELVVNGTFADGVNSWTNVIGTAQSVSGKARVIRPSNNSIGRLSSTAIVCVPGRLYRLTAERYAGTSAGTEIAVANNFASVAQGTVLTNISVVDGTFTGYFIATQTNHWVFLQTRNGAEIGQFCEYDNVSVREIAGNHAFQQTAIDRPVLRQDSDNRYFLSFNGTNTWMQTSAINFTSTDKVTVFVGLRKLSDSDVGMIAEFGNYSTTNGCFGIASRTEIASYGFRSRGTILSSTVSSGSPYPSPHSSILTGVGNISGDSALIRANGTQFAISSSDQGTGTYGNQSLFIGRRGGTSLPFNGQIHGIVIRGASTTDAQIVAMERWLALRTGVII